MIFAVGELIFSVILIQIKSLITDFIPPKIHTFLITICF